MKNLSRKYILKPVEPYKHPIYLSFEFGRRLLRSFTPFKADQLYHPAKQLAKGGLMGTKCLFVNKKPTLDLNLFIAIIEHAQQMVLCVHFCHPELVSGSKPYDTMSVQLQYRCA